VAPADLPEPTISAQPGPEALSGGTHAPPTPPREAVRELPRQWEIKYAVLVGEEGFAAGEAVDIWHLADGRDSLVSTVQAVGLAALFVQGRIVQVSEGDVDAHGLQPEHYWMKRGERRQETARFLWAQNRIDLGGKHGVHDLTPQAQDLLSFPFHLAMTVREGEPDFALGVTNGRHFKQYVFHNLGRESMRIGGRYLALLHLQGSRAGEGSLDVWLDPERAGLPVKVRTLDQKGQTMMLLLQEVRESAGS